MENSSPSAKPRGVRSAMSLSDTSAPIWLQNGTAWGATARKSLSPPALVRLEVRISNIAQALHRNHLRDGFLNQRKHPAEAGVEQQRLIVNDQVLPEAEAAGDEVPLRRGADAVDAACDFVDSGSGFRVGDHFLLLSLDYFHPGSVMNRPTVTLPYWNGSACYIRRCWSASMQTAIWCGGSPSAPPAGRGRRG